MNRELNFRMDWYKALSPCYNNCFRKRNCICGLAYYEFIFKQQVYYVRSFPDRLINWVPLNQSNGTVYMSNNCTTQNSTNLNATLNNAQQVQIDVIYPDYSSVDVGKGIQWPKTVFSPYVDATAWPPYKFADLYSTIGVPFFNLGFIVSQSPTICSPTWGTYYSAENGPLNDQIKAIRMLGGDVTISFGGAANVPLHVTAPTVDVLFKQYQLFADAYGLTRIDFDLEGIWISPSYNDANIRNAKAIKMLQDYYQSKGKSIDVWFTLPILPSGLTSSGLSIINIARQEGVNIAGVNAMAMDYGDSAAPNPQGRMGEYGIEAITSLYNQLGGMGTPAERWSRIGITPMIGVNDVVTEVFRQSDAMEVLNFAQTNGVGQISMWSSNRDVVGGSGIPQSDYEFSLLFNAYNEL